MESVDFNDRYLDPPDEPTRSECDNCGDEFDMDDLNRIIVSSGNVLWLCDDCRDIRNEAMISAAEDVLLANRQG